MGWCTTGSHYLFRSKTNTSWLSWRISGIVTITTAASTLACALNHCPDRQCASTTSPNSYNLLLILKAFNHLGRIEFQVYPQWGFTHCADPWDLHLSCPPTDQAVAVLWCQLLLHCVITTSHNCFWFCACTHDSLKSAVEVVPVLFLSWQYLPFGTHLRAKHDNLSHPFRQKTFFNYDSCFAVYFNNSHHHGTNRFSQDYDSALSIFLLFSFFLLSLFAHLYGNVQLEDTCNTSVGLCTCHFVSGWHHACATASAWMAILPGNLARATGWLRMNKVGAKILPTFSIPILNPLSFLLIAWFARGHHPSCLQKEQHSFAYVLRV